MDENEIRITLRLPVGLRDKIAQAAAQNERSMNGEIVTRLEWTLTAHPFAPLIRSLIEMQEELIATPLQILLDDNIVAELEAIAQQRGWTVELVLNKLISGALHHLDEQTPLGKEIEAHMNARRSG